MSKPPVSLPTPAAGGSWIRDDKTGDLTPAAAAPPVPAFPAPLPAKEVKP